MPNARSSPADHVTARTRAILGTVVMGALTFGLPSAASAQVLVQLGDAGPGPGRAILMPALAAPHAVIPPQRNRYLVAEDSTFDRTVISLGNTVVVEGTVHGDLIVVGGDLYMHPGGSIDGRAVAIGGGVYESMLAHTGGIAAYRDFTYDVVPIAGGYSLRYRSLAFVPVVPTFALSGIQGLLTPTYDRSNGLSVPLGVQLAPAHTGIRIAPSVTYRSQLGRLDPAVAVTSQIDRRTALRVDVGRGTFSNDAWIWSDLINSTEYLLIGDDARNYYRASRVQATISRNVDRLSASFEPFVGGRIERARSVGPGPDADGGPWTLLNRHDVEHALRPNPMIDGGTTTSLLAGTRWTWTSDGVAAHANFDEEIGHFLPTDRTSATASTFAQTTVDADITFPTFGTQSLRFDGHGVLTGGREPRQRRVYVGGPGTIPTLDLLERGGNQLVYVDARYSVPLAGVSLPVVGPPVVTLREVLAGAAENQFPTLSQATGIRIGAGYLYAEILVDPVNHHGYAGLGLSIDR